MRISYLTLEAARNGQASYTHIHEIVDGLKRRGWDVTLYQPSYTSKETSPGLFMRLLHSFLVQARLWGEYRKGTLIYVRSHYLAFITAGIAKIFDVPIVHEVNGPYEDAFVTYPTLQKFRSILVPMQRAQYKCASELIAVTSDIKNYLYKETGGKTAYIVPNGANIDLFHANVQKPKDAPEKYALFFGGLNLWHGIPDIITASKTAYWPSDTRLVIIGDGPERAFVENAAVNDNRILYLGKKNYNDIPGYIASAVCGLVTITNPHGRSETGLCPLKLYETLACGVPVIVTDFPGQADLVKEGKCGMIVAEHSPLDIARAVRMLSEDMHLKSEMGVRGSKLVAEHHSWDRRAEDTHKILMKLVK